MTSDEEKEITSYEDGVKEKPYKSVIDMEIYHTDIPKHLVGSNRDVNNPASGSAKDYNDQINELMGGSESLEELEEFTLNDEFLLIFWIMRIKSMKISGLTSLWKAVRNKGTWGISV